MTRARVRMTGPGHRLRALAAGWCSRETMEHVIDPLIADLQREHGDAVRSGRVWKSRWISIAGWITFAKVIVICAGLGLVAGSSWTADDRRAIVQALGLSIAAVVAITILLVLPSAQNYPKVLLHPSPMRFLYLAPYPFAAGMVMGAALGMVLAVGGRVVSRRLVGSALVSAFMCSTIVLVDVAWVSPAANVAYRTTVFGSTDSTPGLSEQSLGAIRHQLGEFDRDHAFAHLGVPAVVWSFDYHRRLALACSPMLFGLFALGMALWFRGRWIPAAAAVVTFLVYLWLVVVVTPWGMEWPAYAAAWLPNATIATLAVAFGTLDVTRCGRSAEAYGTTGTGTEGPGTGTDEQLT